MISRWYTLVGYYQRVWGRPYFYILWGPLGSCPVWSGSSTTLHNRTACDLYHLKNATHKSQWLSIENCNSSLLGLRPLFCLYRSRKRRWVSSSTFLHAYVAECDLLDARACCADGPENHEIIMSYLSESPCMYGALRSPLSVLGHHPTWRHRLVDCRIGFRCCRQMQQEERVMLSRHRRTQITIHSHLMDDAAGPTMINRLKSFVRWCI